MIRISPFRRNKREEKRTAERLKEFNRNPPSRRTTKVTQLGVVVLRETDNSTLGDFSCLHSICSQGYDAVFVALKD